ncbi:DEAD/DEAH box helicase [Actinacidiphila oryziradicis]|uniref:DEAD/DEAH box helicase n=1 Tax=Actinacidiphila oryziradicis TaxID=2571141 RepID=UPI0038994604
MWHRPTPWWASWTGDCHRFSGLCQEYRCEGFLGGAEYAVLESEDLAVIDSCQVLVMTPEKCSLALRQNPAAFEDLQLCVLDEAHLIEEPNGRGALTELVIAEVLHRAPHVRVLFLSALVANAED